jgi:hypothetical protein
MVESAKEIASSVLGTNTPNRISNTKTVAARPCLPPILWASMACRGYKAKAKITDHSIKPMNGLNMP